MQSSIYATKNIITLCHIFSIFLFNLYIYSLSVIYIDNYIIAIIHIHSTTYLTRPFITPSGLSHVARSSYTCVFDTCVVKETMCISVQARMPTASFTAHALHVHDSLSAHVHDSLSAHERPHSRCCEGVLKELYLFAIIQDKLLNLYQLQKYQSSSAVHLCI